MTSTDFKILHVLNVMGPANGLDPERHMWPSPYEYMDRLVGRGLAKVTEHGSWLNMAEIEINRIQDRDRLSRRYPVMFTTLAPPQV